MPAGSYRDQPARTPRRRRLGRSSPRGAATSRLWHACGRRPRAPGGAFDRLKSSWLPPDLRTKPQSRPRRRRRYPFVRRRRSSPSTSWRRPRASSPRSGGPPRRPARRVDATRARRRTAAAARPFPYIRRRVEGSRRSLRPGRTHGLDGDTAVRSRGARATAGRRTSAATTILTTRHDFISTSSRSWPCASARGRCRAPPDPPRWRHVEAMAVLMRARRPRLVAATHIPTNSGLVQPVAEIGRHCRELDLLYLVDACQSAGQFPLDVAAIGCDLLTATCRKWLRGPRADRLPYLSSDPGRGLRALFIESARDVGRRGTIQTVATASARGVGDELRRRQSAEPSPPLREAVG